MLTRFVNVRVYVTCKYRSKRKYFNGRERSKYPPIAKAAETNRRVEVRLLYMLEIIEMFSEIVIIG